MDTKLSKKNKTRNKDRQKPQSKLNAKSVSREQSLKVKKIKSCLKIKDKLKPQHDLIQRKAGVNSEKLKSNNRLVEANQQFRIENKFQKKETKGPKKIYRRTAPCFNLKFGSFQVTPDHLSMGSKSKSKKKMAKVKSSEIILDKLKAKKQCSTSEKNKTKNKNIKIQNLQLEGSLSSKEITNKNTGLANNLNLYNKRYSMQDANLEKMGKQVLKDISTKCKQQKIHNQNKKTNSKSKRGSLQIIKTSLTRFNKSYYITQKVSRNNSKQKSNGKIYNKNLLKKKPKNIKGNNIGVGKQQQNNQKVTEKSKNQQSKNNITIPSKKKLQVLQSFKSNVQKLKFKNNNQNEGYSFMMNPHNNSLRESINPLNQQSLLSTFKLQCEQTLQKRLQGLNLIPSYDIDKLKQSQFDLNTLNNSLEAKQNNEEHQSLSEQNLLFSSKDRNEQATTTLLQWFQSQQCSKSSSLNSSGVMQNSMNSLKNGIKFDGYKNSINHKQRIDLLDEISMIANTLLIKRQTYHLTIRYLDLYNYIQISRNKKYVPGNTSVSIAMSCLILAIKMDERQYQHDIMNAILTLKPQITKLQLVSNQEQIMKLLSIKLKFETLPFYLDYFTHKWDRFLVSHSSEFEQYSSFDCIKRLSLRAVQGKSYQNYKRLGQILDCVLMDSQHFDYESTSIILSLIYLILKSEITIYQQEQSRQSKVSIFKNKSINSQFHLNSLNQLSDDKNADQKSHPTFLSQDTQQTFAVQRQSACSINNNLDSQDQKNCAQYVSENNNGKNKENFKIIMNIKQAQQNLKDIFQEGYSKAAKVIYIKTQTSGVSLENRINNLEESIDHFFSSFVQKRAKKYFQDLTSTINYCKQFMNLKFNLDVDPKVYQQSQNYEQFIRYHNYSPFAKIFLREKYSSKNNQKTLVSKQKSQSKEQQFLTQKQDISCYLNQDIETIFKQTV